MKWYYAAAGTQVGPIDETELNRLVTMGAVRADTLVWHDGLASWQPLGVVRGMAPAAAVVAGRHYGGFWIRFVAKLIDGIILGVAGLILFVPVMLAVRRRGSAEHGLRRGAGWHDVWTRDGGRVGDIEVGVAGVEWLLRRLLSVGAWGDSGEDGAGAEGDSGGRRADLADAGGGAAFCGVGERDYFYDRLHHGGVRPGEAGAA